MRALSRFALVAIGAALGVAPLRAQGEDGRIGVYADLTATQTSATFSLGVPRTLFVVATLEGETAGGMTGAEFRIDGMPEDWLVFVTPNSAANITLGNPFRPLGDTHRANIVFPGCTVGNEARVLLYTAVVIAQSAIEPRDLSVEVGSPPTSPMYTTAVLQKCDPPNYTSVAMPRTTFRMETRAPLDLDYSQLPGYDGTRGVEPESGFPGDLFHFRVSYSANDGLPPAAGSPRVELDANGDGDTDDPSDATFTMSPADQDSTLGNGKEYRFDIALGEPPGGQYRYRFSAIDSHGASVPGAATTWRDLTVDDALADLVVYAEDIRILPNPLQLEELGSVVVRVHNRSDRRVDDVEVRIENLDGVPFLERTLASMGPRSSTEIAGNLSFGSVGAQAIVAIVDPGNDVPETDESNNRASHGVAVGGSSVVTPNPVIGGLPVFVTVPPIAPFAFTGHVELATNTTPRPPLSGGSVIYRPSWEAAHSTRTDGTGAFLASLIAPAVPGTYPLTFVANDGSRADSVTIDINVSPLPGGGQPHAPNLSIQLAATPGTGCPATSATLSATVTNTGDRSSDPTIVRLVQDGTTAVTELPLAGLVPGETTALGPVQAALPTGGLHAFTAHVDPASALRELREDDNAAVANLRVSRECLDLALESMRYTTTRMCTSESIGVQVRVANRGCVTSQPARVAFLADGIEVGSAALSSLEPGGVTDLDFDHGFAPPSCSDLVFRLDPEGAAGSDCDAENNGLSAALCVGDCAPPPPPLPPNFRVLSCELRAQNTRPTAGEAIRFEAWIENFSPVPAPTTVPVRFDVDGNVLGGTIQVGPLLPGQRILVQSPGTWTVDFAPHVVTVTVNPNHQVPESGDDSDNRGIRPLPWDLRPRFIPRCPPNFPAMYSVCNPCINTPFQIRAVVVNDGLFDCDSVAVEFRDVMHGNNSVGRAMAHDLVAGNDCNIAIQPVAIQHTLHEPSSHIFAAVVDPDHVLTENDETNNEYEQPIQAVCGEIPDLVAAVALPFGTVPQPGDTLHAVEVQVTNIGTGIAAAVQARLTVDGILLCDLEMGDLGPGVSNTVVCTTPWVVGADPCMQRLQACADPNSRIGESNESNNCATNGVTGGPDTDLAIYPWTIRVTPPDSRPGEQVLLEVGLYSLRGVETTCELLVEWSPFSGIWFPISEVPLHLPASVQLFPNVATLVWTPPVFPVALRFRLQNICPRDADSTNNSAVGSLPWFIPPHTPVTVSDLEARSTSEGVAVGWKAEPGLEAFGLERRVEDESDWDRLPDRIAAAAGAELASYEVLDRDARPGARLEYRLIGIEAGGAEQVLGVVSVVHDAAAVRAVQLHGVRPNPFRPGNAIEFSLPERRNVQLNVFDAAGRRVASLRSGPQASGRHAVAWDGRDDRGRNAPAGVYFCQLRADSFQQIRRFVLLH